MRRVSFYHILLLFACAIRVAHAEPARMQLAGDKPTEKAILVVEFAEKMRANSKLANAIDDAKREFASVSSLILPRLRDLEAALQNIADGEVGMIILIGPQDTEAINRLAPLYPDIYFTIIDMQNPAHAPNVQSVNFKEEAGAFLLGTIASMRSNTRISVMGLAGDARTHMLADRFGAGVRHSEPATEIDMQLNLKPTSTSPTRPATTVENAMQNGSDVIFALDDDIAELALRTAKTEHKLVVTVGALPPGADTSRLLTYMVKRYDLALMDVLRIYRHKQWRAGEIELGLTGGYVDYSLNAENVELFPKESIDEIESIKDQLAQGRL